jgi:hypothetical protein
MVTRSEAVEARSVVSFRGFTSERSTPSSFMASKDLRVNPGARLRSG